MSGTAHPKTQCHIPEDLNFSNTAIRISDLAINPVFHLFWLLPLCPFLPSEFQNKLNFPVTNFVPRFAFCRSSWSWVQKYCCLFRQSLVEIWLMVSSVPPGFAETLFQIMPQPLPSTSFPIFYCLIPLHLMLYCLSCWQPLSINYRGAIFEVLKVI